MFDTIEKINVACVVVTYNRLSLLKNTIERICSQTCRPDELIVINNASSDGTKEYLEKLDINIKLTILNEQVNHGGAGGFKIGVHEAYKTGADWIWIMDDDSSPSDTALEKLIRPLQSSLKGEEVGFLASRVLWKDDSICYMNTPVVDRDWPEYFNKDPALVRLWSASFVSVLVNRKAVQRVGLPVSEFFIWYDDCEYTSRISYVMKNFYVMDSVVHHLTPENIRPMDFSKLDEGNAWKFCYGIRNESACLVARQRVGVLRALTYSFRQFIVSLVVRRSLALSFKVLVAGIKGIFFPYQKFIDYPEV